MQWFSVISSVVEDPRSPTSKSANRRNVNPEPVITYITKDSTYYAITRSFDPAQDRLDRVIHLGSYKTLDCPVAARSTIRLSLIAHELRLAQGFAVAGRSSRAMTCIYGLHMPDPRLDFSIDSTYLPVRMRAQDSFGRVDFPFHVEGPGSCS